jgi:hypothetical protein
VKAGVIVVSSNCVAGQAEPEVVSATPVKAWESTIMMIYQWSRYLELGKWYL